MDKYVDKNKLPKLDISTQTGDLLWCLNPCVACTRNPYRKGCNCIYTCRHMELWKILVSRCHNGWVPINSKILNKDFLPKKDKRVLVQLDNGWQHVAYYDGNEWQLLCDEYIQIEDEAGLRKVVAWMELPEVMPGILEDKEDDK